jgi:predicted RND superfamily exporter protein
MIFRSLRVAAIALVPNVLPIGMAFGFMGLLGVPLDAGTVIVGSLALGIAVDDTIHLTERFVRNRREGETPQAALGGALRWVLGPLVLTTLVVSIGFSVLGVSGFTLTRNLGLLTAGVMMLCLAADLVLLPVLLLRSGAISRSPKPT